MSGCRRCGATVAGDACRDGTCRRDSGDVRIRVRKVAQRKPHSEAALAAAQVLDAMSMGELESVVAFLQHGSLTTLIQLAAGELEGRHTSEDA